MHKESATLWGDGASLGCGDHDGDYHGYGGGDDDGDDGDDGDEGIIIMMMRMMMILGGDYGTKGYDFFF